jgi:2'-5' RNA ligase
MTDEADERTTLRLFFAIDLDAQARAAAAAVARSLRGVGHGDGVHWAHPEGLHVTLRFLGNVAAERVAGVTRHVRAQTAALAPFRLELGGARLFPSRRRARFVVLDVGPMEPLCELAEAVERGAVEAGFEPEPRPFRAHLTLGRIRGKNPPTVTGDVTAAGESCVVAETVLFQSRLHRSGARYTPVERIPLDANSPLN